MAANLYQDETFLMKSILGLLYELEVIMISIWSEFNAKKQNNIGRV